MRFLRNSLIGLVLVYLAAGGMGAAQPATSSAALPDIRQLMNEVIAHQKQLEKVRENYTFSSTATTEELDSGGHVKKTESEDHEAFFVNGHVIERTVKKNGQPLDDHDEQKETERITKLVEKAEKTPPGESLEGPSISVSRVVEIMDVRNPRRENYRGRPTIVFDFVGRKDAKTHGVAEDASKKLQGTVWVDEADREIAHMEVSFNENFHVAGGLFVNVEKGSSFRFDQAPVNGEIWLPTAAEGTVQARILLLKNVRQHFVEHDHDYKRFRVDAQQQKEVTVVESKHP